MESSRDKHHAAAPRNKSIRISRTLCLVALGVAVLLSYSAGRLAQKRGVLFSNEGDKKLDDHGGGESSADKQATMNKDLLALILADRPDRPPVFHSSTTNFRVKSWDTTSKEFEDPSTPSNTPPYLHSEKGDLQLSSRIYAELLVQPALLAHPNPKFVGIFMPSSSSTVLCPSSTATAIVDQVLQYSSIVEAITIFADYPDGDQQDQQAATNSCPSDSESYCESTADTATLTTHQQNCVMPSWAASASDDATHRPRIEVVRYSSSLSSSSLVQEKGANWTHSRQKFNVVILDNDSIIRDAHQVAVSSEERSGDDNATDTTIGSGFWKDILDDENGILVTALRGRHDYNRLETIRHNLDRPGYYAKITDYRASIGSSSKLPSSSPLPIYYFAVAFKNWTTFAFWHMNEAEYTLRLRQRHILDDDQHDGRFLHVFDGPTMTTFSYPSRKSARIYCQVEYGDKCNEIELEQYALDPYVANVDQLQVKPSSIGGPYAGRGVFTLEDAPKGSYFCLLTSSHAVRVPWTTFQVSDELIDKNLIAEKTSEPLVHYFDGYGFYNEVFGRPAVTVDSDKLTFANHGCNSTFNVGRPLPGGVDEFSIDLDQPPDKSLGLDDDVYDPMDERFAMFYAAITRANRDISKGEELLDNYLVMGGENYLRDQVNELRQQCQGIPGEIERFQNGAARK